MARRIVRTGVQLAGVVGILLTLIFLLDNRYRVLPKSVHAWSPVHHHGLLVTDLTLSVCSSVNPFSSCSLDAAAGWERISKDLFLNSGWLSQGYVQVQRKKEEDFLEGDMVVMDVRVSRLDPTLGEKGQGENKWEQRPGGIWILRSKKKSASDSDSAVTAIDVLFGSDAADPRPGWEVKDQALDVQAGQNAAEPRLTIRRGEVQTPDKPTPKVRKGGKFKIAQLSDVHLSTGLGRCRDEYPPTSHCEADPRTIGFISEVLDNETPDLAVLSGDVVNGETSPDSQTALFKIAELLIKRNIPWTIIFGNHDDEGSLSRAELMSLAESLPLCIASPGPATIDGVGNYVIEVSAAGSAHHSAITLYHLDSHAYSPDESHYPGYDWIKPSQISWFREEAATRRASPAHKDYSKHHMNMAFIHIPLPEAGDEKSVVADSGKYLEPITAPRFNSGFKDAMVENGIVAVGYGHDHANDYCAIAQHSDPDALGKDDATYQTGSGASGAGSLVPEDVKQRARGGRAWLCYAGGAGYGGYGGYGGYERRVRLWEFDMEQARLETWHKVDGRQERRNDKLIVENGRTVLG